MSRLSFIACILVAAFAVAPVAEAADSDRIVLKRRTGLSAAERADVRADADVTLERTLGIAGVEVVVADDGDRARAVSELRADPDVVWAEPDRLRAAAADPLAELEWALDNSGQSVWGRRGTLDADIDAPEAWAISRGDGATVAVVDSGVDLAHPDLAAGLLPGYDWVDDDSVPQDLNGHGTHVAGTVAAAENGLGAVGVAPEAGVIPLRVLGANGAGWGSDVAAAFDWAGDRGVRIVNASLGSDRITTAERLAIREHPGTLYVVAAGNDGENVDATPHYPCAYTEANVLCVGATNSRDEIASFSNYGANAVDLFAPGVDIASTYPTGLGSYLDDGYDDDERHLDGHAARGRRRRPGRRPSPRLHRGADQGRPHGGRRPAARPGRQGPGRRPPQRRRRPRHRPARARAGAGPHGRRRRPPRRTPPRPRPPPSARCASRATSSSAGARARPRSASPLRPPRT